MAARRGAHACLAVRKPCTWPHVAVHVYLVRNSCNLCGNLQRVCNRRVAVQVVISPRLLWTTAGCVAAVTDAPDAMWYGVPASTLAVPITDTDQLVARLPCTTFKEPRVATWLPVGLDEVLGGVRLSVAQPPDHSNLRQGVLLAPTPLMLFDVPAGTCTRTLTAGAALRVFEVCGGGEGAAVEVLQAVPVWDAASQRVRPPLVLLPSAAQLAARLNAAALDLVGLEQVFEHLRPEGKLGPDREAGALAARAHGVTRPDNEDDEEEGEEGEEEEEGGGSSSSSSSSGDEDDGDSGDSEVRFVKETGPKRRAAPRRSRPAAQKRRGGQQQQQQRQQRQQGGAHFALGHPGHFGLGAGADGEFQRHVLKLGAKSTHVLVSRQRGGGDGVRVLFVQSVNGRGSGTAWQRG